jgi:hypothetical protein
MKIKRESHWRKAVGADVADKANVSEAAISLLNPDGMTISDLSVTDLLEYWRAGHAARSA